MSYRYLTDLAAVLKAAGLEVTELPGWKGRGRPASTGNFDPSGVLCHHTGGATNGRGYAEWMALKGRSDLPAPLCHLSIDRQGHVYVCAAGRANHAGKAKASGPMPAGDGNALYVGIEAQNTGSEGWTQVQRDAYVAVCAALCAHYRWPASHVRAHRETSVTGKWDPGRLDMDQLRTDVAHRITNPEDEDDMSAADVKRLEDKLDNLAGQVAKVVAELGTDGVHVPKAHPDYNPKNTTSSIRRAMELLLLGDSRLPQTLKDTLGESTVTVEVPK